MTPSLTREFKNHVSDIMLETSKHFVLTNFNQNDKVDKTIHIVSNEHDVTIIRNCFNVNDNSKPYYEDYTVYFSAIIENQKVKSKFFLEWKNNELIPGNANWNYLTGECSDRRIKIKKCIK